MMQKEQQLETYIFQEGFKAHADNANICSEMGSDLIQGKETLKFYHLR